MENGILKPFDKHLESIMEYQVKRWMELIKENDDVEVPPSVTQYYFKKIAKQ